MMHVRLLFQYGVGNCKKGYLLNKTKTVLDDIWLCRVFDMLLVMGVTATSCTAMYAGIWWEMNLV